MTKVFYRLDIELTSPMTIGSGENEYSDYDVLTDSSGRPYIPGSTIAGVLSHECDEETARKLFGQTENIDESKMSSVIVYDAEMVGEDEFHAGRRDNVALGENKAAIETAKFDYQIVDAGSKFKLIFEINDTDGKKNNLFQPILALLMSGNVSFGHKTTRGFGRFKVNQLKQAEFTNDDFDIYRSFDPLKAMGWSDYELESDLMADNGVRICLGLKQAGGLSVREYNGEASAEDFRPVSSNGAVVVPGTSWAGAFKADMINNLKVLCRISYDDAKAYVENLFGSARGNKGVKSRIFFNESRLNNNVETHVTRVKIDRFSGGASDSALFDEIVSFKGDTELVIKVVPFEKTSGLSKEDYDALIGLLLISVRCLKDKLFTVGGQASIGRGMFDVVEEKIFIDGEEQHDAGAKTYYEALKKRAREGFGSKEERS